MKFVYLNKKRASDKTKLFEVTNAFVVFKTEVIPLNLSFEINVASYKFMGQYHRGHKCFPIIFSMYQ